MREEVLEGGDERGFGSYERMPIGNGNGGGGSGGGGSKEEEEEGRESKDSDG